MNIFSPRRTPRRTFSWRMLLPLGMLLLLPVLVYTGLELSRLNEQESLLQNLYQSQLDAILFSVNQYCWDVVSGWGNALFAETSRTQNNEELVAGLERVRMRYNAVRAAFVYEQEQMFLSVPDSLRAQQSLFAARLSSLLSIESAALARMHEHAAKGYVRPLVLPLQNTGSAQEELLVLYPNENVNLSGVSQLSGLLLSTEQFVQTVLRPKIAEFENQNFLLAVKRADATQIFFATQDVSATNFEYEEPLWVLPQMTLAIKLRGASTAEIVRTRTKRTLYLLAGVNAIILLAVVLFLRTLLRETQLARLKSDFVDNVSHDLRTPLGLIRMFAETLQLGRVNAEEKRQEYYSILVREAERLTRMVNNLLDFSRIEAGRKVYEQKTIALAPVLREVLNSYRYHLQQRGFVLEEKFSESLPAIDADAEAASQAFVNLLDNAVKYSEAEKHIRVALYRAEEWVVLEVTDRGLGIAPQEHRKIFDKFYRVEALGSEARGAGIGLALVQHVMTAHHGKVEVQSALGQGSSFRLKFPVQAR